MKVITNMAKLQKAAGREVTVIYKGRVNVTPNGVWLEPHNIALEAEDFDNGVLILRGDK